MVCFMTIHFYDPCQVGTSTPNLSSLRQKYLGSFLLDPVDIRVLGVGAIWNFVKGTGLL